MPSNNFYNTSRRTEPDMRQEFTNFLDGSFPEVAKKQVAILRKMRRDSDGNPIQCACVNSTTNEPDKDTWCPYCSNEGFYWDESFIEVYKIVLHSDVGNALNEDVVEPTLMNIPSSVFYLKATVRITDKDKIVELVLGANGTPVRPYRRRSIYRVGTLLDMRADEGKLEYWKATCFYEQHKYLNGPGV